MESSYAKKPEGPRDRQQKTLANSVLRFCQELRKRGISINTGGVIDALQATTLIDVFDRSQFYTALRATLVNKKNDMGEFNRAFNSFWRIFYDSEQKQRIAKETEKSNDSQNKPPDEKQKTETSETSSQSTRWMPDEIGGTQDASTIAPSNEVYSSVEILKKGDLGSLQDVEFEEIAHVLRKVAHRLAVATTRRMEPDDRGSIDLRRTLRENVKYGSEILEVSRRRKSRRNTKLVMICDVSGSMKSYSQFAVQYLYAFKRVFEKIEIFVFSTRLTRITRELRHNDFARVIEGISDSVMDWGGGTKIGGCLSALHQQYGRLIDKRSVVIMISDGMDTGDTELLEEQMKRLKQKSKGVIWLNPLLEETGYRPVCRGMQAALPYIDKFTCANTMAGLLDLTKILSTERFACV